MGETVTRLFPSPLLGTMGINMHFADQVFFAIFDFYLFFNVNDSHVPIKRPEQVVCITFLNSLVRLINEPASPSGISSLVSSNEFVLMIACLIHQTHLCRYGA